VVFIAPIVDFSNTFNTLLLFLVSRLSFHSKPIGYVHKIFNTPKSYFKGSNDQNTNKNNNLSPKTSITTNTHVESNNAISTKSKFISLKDQVSHDRSGLHTPKTWFTKSANESNPSSFMRFSSPNDNLTLLSIKLLPVVLSQLHKRL